ncbi:hypothetical protein ACTJJ0_27790 [Chitinophaga sp. 22321]|uniref:Uncharacterized protein n=1 Tax=Chitinophaga hostae TaxID=2831022 RepID=A0ABS5J784_9BACT|nr:hypothetical protein [Chitinophaga hostae]MBS0030936.1 hypothetical protein [Chitinophaga hostae]
MNPVTITVYLQALGGKFLGPNAFSIADEPITVSFICGSIDANLPYAAATSDDGNISSGFSNSIPYTLPILTLDNNTYTENFLTTDSNTIAGTVTVPASAITPFMNAAIIAVIPRPTGIPLKIVQNVVLTAGQSAYTFTLLVPGLLLEPATDAQPADTISVLVKMMCGCKLTVNTSKSFWAPDDFEVMAYLSYSDGSVVSYPMSFDTMSNDSTFIAVINDNAYTEIYFTAQQRSTGNYGYLNVLPA